MTSLRSLTSAWLVTALLALAGCGGGQDAPPAASQAPAARIEIAPSAVLLTAPGASKSLSAKVFDAAGNPLTTAVEWTSSRPAQVTVDAAGVVTAAGAGGSSQVTARIGTLASPPLLVVHTTVPAGTVLVNDANISGDPVETNPDAPPGVGNTYVVRLVDVAAPKVGDLLMNTEAKVVAGRVVSVQTAGGVHTVTLGLPPAREMFPNLAIDEVIDLSQAAIEFPAEVQDRFDIKREGNTFTFAPKPGKFDLASAAPGSRSQAQASGRERPLAVLATRSLGPFECNGVVDGAAGAGSLPLALTVPPAFTIAVNPRLDVVSTPAHGLERFVLHYEPTFSADWGVRALFAFEGKITCEAKLFEIKIPVGGPLALIIGGQFPVGVGVEVGGKLTALSMGITWKATAKTTVDVGLACPGGTNCDVVKTFGPLETSVVPTYDVPLLTDLRLEPSVSTYAFVEAAIGNPFLKSLRFKAFKAKAGAALKGNFASQAIQVADPAYSSDYKLVSELKAGADTGFIGFAGFLGLNAFAETVLEVSTDLGNSPTGTVTADVAEFNLDDTVNFTVKLDPRKADFIPLIGPYNVERIVLVRRGSSLNATEVASVTALPGQTEFNIPFQSTSLGTGRTNEFFAFVVTKLLPTVLPPLELGQATTALGLIELRGSVALNSTTTTRTSRSGSTSETVVTVNVNAPVRYDAERSGLVLLQAGFTGSEVRESRSVTEIDRSPCIFDSVIETVERTTITPRGPEFGSIDFQLTGDNWVLGDPSLPVTKQTTTTTRQSTTNARGDCSRTDLSTTTRVEEFPPRSSNFDPPLSLSLTSTPVFSGSLSRDAQGLRSLAFADSLTQSDARFTPPKLLETTVQISLRDQPAP